MSDEETTAQAKLDELRAKATSDLCVMFHYPPGYAYTTGLVKEFVDTIIEAAVLKYDILSSTRWQNWNKARREADQE